MTYTTTATATTKSAVYNPLSQQHQQQLDTIEEGDDEDSPRINKNNNNNNIEEEIRRFYQKHNPAKIDELPQIMLKYKGKEQQLKQKLMKQYNVTSL